MRCIISYDIADDRRRRRVVKRLAACAHRVQYSVFEGELDEAGWRQVWRDLNRLIEPTQDGLLMVPVCEGCGSKRREAGTTGRVMVEEAEVL